MLEFSEVNVTWVDPIFRIGLGTQVSKLYGISFTFCLTKGGWVFAHLFPTPLSNVIEGKYFRIVN